MSTLQPTYDIKKLEGHDVCQENNAGQGEYTSMQSCLFALNQKKKDKKQHFLPGQVGPKDTWPTKANLGPGGIGPSDTWPTKANLGPGGIGPSDTWPDNYHKTKKLSCCEIVAIVAGSLVLLLLLVSLVSNVAGGAKKTRRTARRTARRSGKRK